MMDNFSNKGSVSSLPVNFLDTAAACPLTSLQCLPFCEMNISKFISKYYNHSVHNAQKAISLPKCSLLSPHEFIYFSYNTITIEYGGETSSNQDAGIQPCILVKGHLCFSTNLWVSYFHFIGLDEGTFLPFTHWMYLKNFVSFNSVFYFYYNYYFGVDFKWDIFTHACVVLLRLSLIVQRPTGLGKLVTLTCKYEWDWWFVPVY